MKKFYVYVHTCPNGKRYVGVTTQTRPERRWLKGNGYRYNKHFYSAIKKYGWNNFQHEVFEVDSKEEMYYAEKYLIAYYHTTESKFGYNRSIGGKSGSSGCIYPEEGRKKISEAAKKRCSDPEYLRKQSEAQKKSHSDPEYRKKTSEAAKKRCSDPEFRRKMSEAQKKVQKKVHLDPEYRKKISKANKGKPKPKVKIKLPDGTIIKTTKNIVVRWYVNRGKEFEYVS